MRIVMSAGGSAGTAGAGFRTEPAIDEANRRRLAWFGDDELVDEVRRRGLAPTTETGDDDE